MSKTSYEVHKRYKKKAFDTLGVVIPKGRRDDLNAYAKAHNTTVSAMINEFCRTALGMTEEEWKKRAVADDQE